MRNSLVLYWSSTSKINSLYYIYTEEGPKKLVHLPNIVKGLCKHTDVPQLDLIWIPIMPEVVLKWIATMLPSGMSINWGGGDLFWTACCNASQICSIIFISGESVVQQRCINSGEHSWSHSATILDIWLVALSCSNCQVHRNAQWTWIDENMCVTYQSCI